MFYANLAAALIMIAWFIIDLSEKDYSWFGAKGTGLLAALNLLCLMKP